MVFVGIRYAAFLEKGIEKVGFSWLIDHFLNSLEHFRGDLSTWFRNDDASGLVLEEEVDFLDEADPFASDLFDVLLTDFLDWEFGPEQFQTEKSQIRYYLIVLLWQDLVDFAKLSPFFLVMKTINVLLKIGLKEGKGEMLAKPIGLLVWYQIDDLLELFDFA